MNVPRGYAEAAWLEAKAQARTILYDLASARVEKRIFYSDLAAQIGAIRFHHREPALNELLDQLSREEHAAGRGMLSVLVVTKEDGAPGGGFFKMAAAVDPDAAEDREALLVREFNAVRAAHRRS